MRLYRGFPKLGVPYWGPHNKDYSILGSILGSPYFGKLPYRDNGKNGNYTLGLYWENGKENGSYILRFRVSGSGIRV